LGINGKGKGKESSSEKLRAKSVEERHATPLVVGEEVEKREIEV
jgi:hypothetical protein